MKDFSRTYYGNFLTELQHIANNIWFEQQIETLRAINKKLYIPELNTYFDNNGNPLKYDIIVADLVS